jgi:hypothetical protein
MVDVARPSNTVAIREEVLRLEAELKIRQWHEQQLAIADGYEICMLIGSLR